MSGAGQGVSGDWIRCVSGDWTGCVRVVIGQCVRVVVDRVCESGGAQGV